MTTAGSTGPTAIDWENLISAGRDLLNPRTNGAPPTGEQHQAGNQQRVLRDVPRAGAQQRRRIGRGAT